VLRSTETTGQALRSDKTARAADDEIDDMPPPVEKPRKRRGHSGFHFHFGGFRF